MTSLQAVPLSIPEAVRARFAGEETEISLRNSLGPIVPIFNREALLGAFKLSASARLLVICGGQVPEGFEGDTISCPAGLLTASFEDAAFDLAVWLDGLACVISPEQLLREVQRVARAGILETPSVLAEIMAPEPENRWLVHEESGELVLHPVPFLRAPYRHIGRRILRDLDLARRWYLTYRNISKLQFCWKGGFEFRTEPRRLSDPDIGSPKVLAERYLDRAINTLRYGAGSLQDALRDAAKAVEANPDWALAWNTTGVCLWATGNIAEAASCFQRAVSLDSLNAAYHANASLRPGQEASLALLPAEPCDQADITENWAGKVYYAFVGYDDRLALDIGIRPGDRVLDVGGGQRPLARADVSVDFDVFEGLHRQGQAISREKPLVCGDVQRLPFADGAFDVVCCRMVLEHVEDPAAAVRELQRVGKKVFIEVPNVLWECFYGHPCHRWFISLEDGVLRFRRKLEAALPFRGAIIPFLYTQPDLQRRFEVTLRNLSTIQIVADGSLRAEVVDDPNSPYDYNRPEDAYEASMAYARDLVRMGLPSVAAPEIEDALRAKPGDAGAIALRREVARLTGDRETADRLSVMAVLGEELPSAAIRPRVSWFAPLLDPSGYAEEARHFLLALELAGIPVAARSIRWSDRVAVLPESVERLLSNASRLPLPDGGVHVSHILAPHFQRREGARLNIGRTMFETDRLPEEWAAACNRMDRIWVPSEFNRQTFAFAGVDERKLRVVPGAIDLAAYPLDAPPLHIDGAKAFNFLSVFDWSLRKGWDVLIRAFVEEFGPNEDVSLTIKTHSSLGYTIEWIAEAVACYIRDVLGHDMERIPDIIFQDGNIPAARMPSLYAACDCFVLPTRGEGWGRPYMEAMAMAKPVIGTNWSGNTAFMTAENSYLLDYELAPVSEDAVRETATFHGHRWAEPSCEHLKRLMRHVVSNRQESAAIGRAARADLGARFSYEAVGQILARELETKSLRAAA